MIVLPPADTDSVVLHVGSPRDPCAGIWEQSPINLPMNPTYLPSKLPTKLPTNLPNCLPQFLPTCTYLNNVGRLTAGHTDAMQCNVELKLMGLNGK